MSGQDVLAELVAAARARVTAAAAQERLTELAARARDAAPRADRFAAALSRTAGIAIIAECKAASPSRGTLVRDYAPASIAAAYEAAGAAAVSVLTEPERFGGSLAHLAAVRAAVQLPLLRKDFIVDDYQLLEARAAGADAVLLIAAALTQDELTELHDRALDRGLAALVEVHDERELERALAADARIIGVNNRDLRTLRVDLRTSLRLAPLLPADVTAVAESGIGGGADLASLRAAGYHAALVGERLVTAADPGAALRALASGGAAHAEPVSQRVS